MTAKEFKQGASIVKAGQTFNSLGLITKGSIMAANPAANLTLRSGDVVGVADICAPNTIFTYTALEDTNMILYPYDGTDDLAQLLRDNRDTSILFVTSVLKQMNELLSLYVHTTFSSDKLYRYLTESYEEYRNLCGHYAHIPHALPGIDDLQAFSPNEMIENWLIQYYESFRHMDNPLRIQLFQHSPAVAAGFLCITSQHIQQALNACQELSAYRLELSHYLLSRDEPDLFSLLSDLYVATLKVSADPAPLNAALSLVMKQIKDTDCLDKEYGKERIHDYFDCLSSLRKDNSQVYGNSAEKTGIITAITESLNTILNYGSCPSNTANEFRNKIAAFKLVEDKSSDDPQTHKLRMEITKLFYPIYEGVFIKSITDSKIPTVIKMFLYFGYVDEALAGIENTIYLYKLAESPISNPQKGVYTFYDWLMAVYRGEKEPSRNEFDVDYTAYVHELKVSKKITSDQEVQYMQDNTKKMQYELHNLFPTVNKITFGRITSFCPIFTADNVIKDLETCLATTDTLMETITGIRSIDYSAYYREIIYSNPDNKITKEFIHVEVLPDIILMPNIGVRGVMWQEIEGMKRTTPSRFIISIFSLSDINEILIRLTGEYRWEMCKRVQGARWNDVSDPSLTSDYCDYIQFYRKNNDLSTQAKEQLKSNLQKAKNNFRESFVRDYLIWVVFEGSGSPRLNKVARSILFNYCPFSAEVRMNLETNPIFSECLNRFMMKKAQRENHINNVIKKLYASGAPVPAEIENEADYLNF